MRTIALLILLIASQLSAQQPVYFEQLPTPSGVVAADPEMKWHRWASEEFTIHAIDPKQGEYLYNNLPMMKNWAMTRWGLNDLKLQNPIRIFCTNSKDSMQKLFGFDASCAESKDRQDKILWLVLDGKPAETVPQALSVAVLSAYDKQGVPVNWWAQRGISVLNMTLPQIRKNLTDMALTVQSDKEIFVADALFKATEADWKAMSPQMKKIFDAESAVMCLMMRKEFGQMVFHESMASNQVSKALGFETSEELNRTFKRYLTYLVQDVQSNKTPDNYLQIHAKNLIK